MSDLDRIKIVIQWLVSSGVAANQGAIAALMGYKNKSAFSQILNGHVPIPKKFIESLSSLHTDINPDWILTGKGELIKKFQEDKILSKDLKNNQHNFVTEPQTEYSAPLDPLSQLIRNNTILVESNAVMADSVKKLADQIIEIYSNKPPVSITDALETMKKEIAETIRGELKNNHAREDVGCADAG